LKGKTASFTEMCFGRTGFVKPSSCRVFPSITFVASFARGTPIALLTKGWSARRGVDLKDVELAVLDRVLNVHQADYMEFLSDQLRRRSIVFKSFGEKVIVGRTQALSPE